MEDRRKFIKRAAIAGAATAGFGIWGYSFHDPNNPVRRKDEKIYTVKDFAPPPSDLLPEMVIARGSDPAKNVRAAIDRLGSISHFINPGDNVVIKPNVGWDRLPEQAANTNPLIVAETVRLCREARAGSITVTDVSVNDVVRCFARSGIGDAAREAGAIVRFASSSDFLPCDLKGKLLKVWPVYRQFLDADKIINLPVVKHHSLSKATLSMKNWYGVLGGKRNRLHQEIDTSIADLATAFRPTLTIMDASRILMRGGPTGGNLDDVKKSDTVIAGTDEVALDSYAGTLLGYRHDEIEHVKIAHQRGVGKLDPSLVRMDELVI